MKRVRLDAELVAQGYCATQSDAARCVMAGLVSSRGERFSTPGAQVVPGIELHVKDRKPYVSRGGVKLAGGLDAFGVDPAGLRCLDVGCSSGGFTDCLLKRGATSVISVDVGRAQFDWSLRNDERVDLLESTNIVDVPALGYEGVADLAVCDVSFTSVERILGATLDILTSNGRFLTLVKPQFEADPKDVGEGGIIRDKDVQRSTLARVTSTFAESGLFPIDVCVSPIKGHKGNREFFLLGDRAKMKTVSSSDLQQHMDTLMLKIGSL